MNNTIKSRQIIKKSSVAGVIPTIPTGSLAYQWADTDIYDGEYFLNTSDNRLWIRSDDELIELTEPTYGGILISGSFADNGDGTITIGSGSVALYHTSDYSGNIYEYDYSGSTITTTPNSIGYVYIDYGGGSASLAYTTDQEDISQSSEQILYTVYNDDNTVVYRLGWDEFGNGLAEKMHNRFIKTSRFEREFTGGLILAESGSRNVLISEGNIWYGAIRKNVPTFNSTSDALVLVYHSASIWINEVTSSYNNFYYDNGTNLVELSNNNRYTINWVYRMIGDEATQRTCIVLSNDEYSTLEEAKLGQPPTLPDIVLKGGLLVGRIIVKKNLNTGTVESAFTTTFAGTSVTNHNDLANIQGGTTGEYYHLTSASYAEVSNLSASYASYVPYTGAISDVNLGAHNLTLTGSLNATSITGSLFGTSSWSIYSTTSSLSNISISSSYSLSSSYTTTSSYANNSYMVLPVIADADGWSPTDNTTYFFGGGGIPAAATRRRIYIWYPGTITTATIWGYATTAGSNEKISMYIRKNNSTDTLIQTEGVAANARNWENTSLSIPVVSGDYIEIKMVNPLWATNPVFDALNGYIVIKL